MARSKTRAYDVSGDPLDRLGNIGAEFLGAKPVPRTGLENTLRTGLTLGEPGGFGAAGHLAGLPFLPAAAAGYGASLGGSRMVGNYLRKPELVDRMISGQSLPLAVGRSFFESSSSSRS